MELRSAAGPLRLLTTVTTFAPAVDVTVAELKLAAFLPADAATAAALTRWGEDQPRGTGSAIESVGGPGLGRRGSRSPDDCEPQPSPPSGRRPDEDLRNGT